MATTYTWAVANLERHTADGIVYTVHYTVSAEDDTYREGLVTTVHWTATLGEAYNYGSLGLGAPDPDNYTPYDEITETQAVDWAKAALGPETVSGIESSLASQEEEILNPTTADGVPW